MSGNVRHGALGGVVGGTAFAEDDSVSAVELGASVPVGTMRRGPDAVRTEGSDEAAHVATVEQAGCQQTGKKMRFSGPNGTENYFLQTH
jgi:hypothetical protein